MIWDGERAVMTRTREKNSRELKKKLEPAKVALDFNVLLSCPADSHESRDCDRHFRNGDFAAQQRRSRNLRLAQEADPTLADILNPGRDRWFGHAAVIKRRALLGLDVQYVGKPRIPPAIGLLRSFHANLMITHGTGGVNSSNGLVQ
jgi:hypothetical protein